MTTRQERLKDEIIRISDIAQLGIRSDDRDWFYLFTQRFKDWNLISRLHFISQDFLDEFPTTAKWHGYAQFELNSDKPLSYAEQFIDDNNYYTTSHFYFLLFLAKDSRLTDEFVIKHEKSFDFTHTNSGSNACPTIKENAWYYILRNPSISGQVKQRFKDKPQIALTAEERNRKEKKSCFSFFNS